MKLESSVALPALTGVAARLSAPFADDPREIHAGVLYGFCAGLARVAPSSLGLAVWPTCRLGRAQRHLTAMTGPRRAAFEYVRRW